MDDCYYVGHCSIYYIIFFPNKASFLNSCYNKNLYTWKGLAITPCIMLSESALPEKVTKEAEQLPKYVYSKKLPYGMTLSHFLDHIFMEVVGRELSETLLDILHDCDDFLNKVSLILFNNTPEFKYLTMLRYFENQVTSKLLYDYKIKKFFVTGVINSLFNRKGTMITDTNNEYAIAFEPVTFSESIELNAVVVKYNDLILDYLRGTTRDNFDEFIDDICLAILDTVNSGVFTLNDCVISCTALSSKSIFSHILYDITRQIVFGKVPSIDCMHMPSLLCLVSNIDYEDVDVLMEHIIEASEIYFPTPHTTRSIRVKYDLDNSFIFSDETTLNYSLDDGIIDQIRTFIQYAFACVIFREVRGKHYFNLEMYDVFKGRLDIADIVISTQDNKYILGEYKL